MKIGFCYLAIAVSLAPSAAPGQVYTISGAPTPNDSRAFEISLIRVSDDGSASAVAELFPQTKGAEWVGVSQERRKAVVLSNDQTTAIVLDLDTASLAKTRTLPSLKGAFLMTSFLADVPGRGLIFEWFVKGPPGVNERLFGMIIDPAVPCGANFVETEHSDAKFIVANGAAGVGDIRSPDGVAAVVGRDGSLIPAVFADDQIPWKQKLPLSYVGGLPNPPTPASVVINNSETMLVHVATGDRAPLYLALRKRDQTWHSIHIRTDEWDRLRSFGNFIAITEARPKKASDRISYDNFDLQDLKEMEKTGRLSPGVNDWRTALQPDSSPLSKKSPYGLDIFESFRQAEDIYPGRLVIFDLDTEKSMVIDTKQGDSEVVLIDGDNVYYRVTNRIYSAQIQDGKLGAAKLIAQGPLIEDVHYLFIKR